MIGIEIFFAIPFGIFGLLHLIGAQNMAGMVKSWIPGGVFWVYLTGLAHIAATISIIAQKKARLASLLLAAMLGVFVLMIHLPGIMGQVDPLLYSVIFRILYGNVASNN